MHLKHAITLIKSLCDKELFFEFMGMNDEGINELLDIAEPAEENHKYIFLSFDKLVKEECGKFYTACIDDVQNQR